jgi:ketosteroid isomerase-like protein
MLSEKNTQLIQQFYTAFANRDGDTMASLYHPDAHFSDPAFDLNGAEAIGNMWRMLCRNGKDLQVEFRDVVATDTIGSVHWEAWYTFSKTKRKVHNKIDAQFEFRDGKIYRHKDVFDFWLWSRQALGPIGLLLGWTPFLHRKVRETAIKGLIQFRAVKNV